MNYQEQENQKRLESETLAYKNFMKVAKKVSYLQYGKWTIVPSADDPLRKFTLEKACDWFTLRVSLHMVQHYRRGLYYGNPDKYYYTASLSVSGMFKDMNNGEEHTTELGIKLKPRMAKKFIQAVDEVIVPKFYLVVEQDSKEHRTEQEQLQAFRNNVLSVEGLIVHPKLNTWDQYNHGALSNCEFDIMATEEEVKLTKVFTYEELARVSKRYGWGK